MNKTKQLYALLAATALASTATVQANLIVNGSFEEIPGSGLPSQGWQQYVSINGWTSTGTPPLEIGKESVYNVTGAVGDQKVVMELDSTANVLASTTTSLAAGNYSLTFLYAKRGNGNSSQSAAASSTFDVTLTAGSSTTVIASFGPTATAMSSALLSFAAPSGAVLGFRGTGTSDSYGALIDDVNLVVVPEPSTYVAGGLALLPLLFGLRSRFAKK